MADVLTTVWSLVKQTIGGNRNTWGTILNANMDLIEAALSGVLSKAVTGGAVALTDTERQNRILDFSGTLASASTVTVGNYAQVWLVRNGTSGSYSLSMKTSGGTAVEIPQGGWNLVWCDGNDVVSVGPSSLLFDTQFKAPDGTISAPGLAFLNETTLGFRRAGYSSGTMALDPFTTDGSTAVVAVNHVGHGLSTGDYAFYSGGSAVGGITIAGLYPVTVSGVDDFTITHSENSTSAATGGGTPAYKYMKAAATAGGAVAITKGGADIAHVSPYGVILTGSLYVTGAFRAIGNALIGGTLGITGALTGAAATFTGALIGAAATFSGLLTLSSTSHFLPPTGTTAQRPGSPTQGSLRYNSDLDSPEWANAGAGWVQPVSAHPIAGGFRNLVIQNNAGTPNTQIDVDADAVIVETTTGLAYRLSSVNLTINAGTTGANGLDADDTSLVIDQLYAVWAIYNPTTATAAGFLSTDDSAPTLPSGYTAKGLLGYVLTKHGSAIFYSAIQRDNCLMFRDAQQVLLDSGTAGTVSATSPTLFEIDISTYVPPKAVAVNLNVARQWTGAGSSNVLVAPSTDWSGTNNGPRGSNQLVWPCYLNSDDAETLRMVLEDVDSIAWASDGGGGAIALTGWEVNL